MAGISKQERAEIRWWFRLNRGVPHSALAAIKGVRYETIRQQRALHDPEHSEWKPWRTSQQRAKLRRLLVRAIKHPPRYECLTCWGEMPLERRYGGRTCSPRCYGLYQLARHQIDPEGEERRRVQQARTILKHESGPDSPYSASQHEWAERLLNEYDATGEIIPRNRRYSNDDSTATDVMKEVRKLRRQVLATRL